MSHGRGLPPELADHERKAIYESLIHHLHCEASDQTVQSCQKWEISVLHLRGHIQTHFLSKFRVYRKPESHAHGRYLPWTGQANVRIHDELEVYVSLSFRAAGRLIIDAHDHTTPRRLPR